MTFLALVSAIAASFLVWLAESWAAMLCLGAAHSHNGSVPAFSFAVVVWLVLALNFAIAGSTGISNRGN